MRLSPVQFNPSWRQQAFTQNLEATIRDTRAGIHLLLLTFFFTFFTPTES
jgi:hypothetical protein